MLSRLLDTALCLTFPQNCLSCGKITESYADGVACGACWSAARVFSGRETICLKCSQYLGPRPPVGESYCHRCDDHHYDAARAVGLYEHALAATIVFLKSEPFLSSRAKTALGNAFGISPFYDADLTVPIPLSRKRRIERGFNQAEVIARGLEKICGIEVDTGSLVRTRHTIMHRAAMDRKARAMTVEKAFEVLRPNFIEGRRILLVDDVFTTGATASSCARELKRSGADRVYVLTLARAR